jgi:transcriptional regulator GlxA family with amidase domain
MKSAENISNRPLRVAVLVLSDCNTLSFAAAVDPMRAANRMAGRVLFDWTYVTATGLPAQLTSGITVTGTPLAQLGQCDLLLVIAGFNLEAHATPALLAGLRRIAGVGALVGGIDGGPWLLARAGLLDGHSATTHWEDLDGFAARFPEVTTVADRFHISGTRMTSGGALPAIDMMLHLIATRYGSALAGRVAAAFIHDNPTAPDRPQTRSGGDIRHNRITARASTMMQQSLETPLKIPALARALGISTRSLELQFQRRLNTSPKSHYLMLRLTEALRLVTQTETPLLDVALAAGFASQSSFARAFRAAHGASARTLRSAAQA